jgi:hypothetical protein
VFALFLSTSVYLCGIDAVLSVFKQLVLSVVVIVIRDIKKMFPFLRLIQSKVLALPEEYPRQVVYIECEIHCLQTEKHNLFSKFCGILRVCDIFLYHCNRNITCSDNQSQFRRQCRFGCRHRTTALYRSFACIFFSHSQTYSATPPQASFFSVLLKTPLAWSARALPHEILYD